MWMYERKPQKIQKDNDRRVQGPEGHPLREEEMGAAPGLCSKTLTPLLPDSRRAHRSIPPPYGEFTTL